MDRNDFKEPVGMMMRTLRMHRCKCEQFLCEIGVHHTQHRVLMYLSCNSAPSQKELAERFHVSAAAMAVTLKKLETGGFIKRATQSGDMRQNNIEITRRGREVIDMSAQFFSTLDSGMFRGITSDELDTFMRCLEKMQNNMKGDNDSETMV